MKNDQNEYPKSQGKSPLHCSWFSLISPWGSITLLDYLARNLKSVSRFLFEHSAGVFLHIVYMANHTDWYVYINVASPTPQSNFNQTWSLFSQAVSENEGSKASKVGVFFCAILYEQNIFGCLVGFLNSVMTMRLMLFLTILCAAGILSTDKIKPCL